MTSTSGNQTPQNVPLGTTPCIRKAVHITIDFSLGNVYTLDMSQIQSQGVFESLQSFYVDNSANVNNLEFDMGVTLQKIIIPAGAEGYFPVLQFQPPILKISTPGSPIIEVHALNFFVPPYLWYPNGQPITDLTLESVISNGAVNVNSLPATLTGPTDASGTITAGGTRQVLFAALATRKRFIISNPSSATEILQFSYVSNTGGLIDLPPGSSWSEADAAVSGDEIWIVAATTGHAFTAYSWHT